MKRTYWKLSKLLDTITEYRDVETDKRWVWRVTAQQLEEFDLKILLTNRPFWKNCAVAALEMAWLVHNHLD